MPSRKVIALQRIDRILGLVDALDARGVGETVQLVEELRRSILAELASSTSDYGRAVLSRILEGLEKATDEFGVRYGALLGDSQLRAWSVGRTAVDTVLAAGDGHALIAPRMTRELLEVAQAYAADLVRGVSDGARAAISQEVRLGVMTGRPVTEVMERIGVNIDRGRFKSIAARAETVTRTETLRVLSLASYVRLRSFSERTGGLQQRWLSVLDTRTRPAHQEAHMLTIPVGESFDVGGEMLRFPRDPAASGANTINCRCVVVPWRVTWEETVSPEEGVVGELPAWYVEREG